VATDDGTRAVLERLPAVDILMRRYRPQSLLQRLIEPEEIANLVVYLSSRFASATTGGAVRVDGGYVDAIVP
jgi:enoyl-[acyl-carrier-protein] reductase (NADH)